MEVLDEGDHLHPRLCDRCQPWSRWKPRPDWSLAVPRYLLTFDHLDANRHCLVCMHILSAVNARIATLESLHIPPTKLLVRVVGPIDLNGSNHYSKVDGWKQIQERRIEQGLPLGIWLLIDVFNVPEPDSPTVRADLCHFGSLYPDGVEPLIVTTFTPRLRAYYTHDGTLSKIEDGNVPHFDMPTIKGWLRFCEENHGPQCLDSTGSTRKMIMPSQSSRLSLKMDGGVSSLKSINTKAVGRFAQKIQRRTFPSQHIQCQPIISKEAIPPGFRLVDTRAFCIVKPDTPVPFVALSYMWSPGGAESSDIKLEKANISLLESPGSLIGSRLPKLILQAMSLCCGLGEQYLWIDRLCIVQDDWDSKSTQIKAMGSIYRSASFTIIAALDSRTTDMGLPGHPEQARRPWSSAFRPLVDFMNDFHLVIPNGVQDIVDKSMWNQRGWTFQERLLSKRRLFITEYEVIFQCASATVEEEFTWDWNYQRLCRTANTSGRWIDESTYSLSPSELALLLMPGYVEEEQDHLKFLNEKFSPDKPSLYHYKRIAEDYSAHQLTFKSDKIHAFNGVANTMTAKFNSRMLFGVPERLLPRCLSWTCKSSQVGWEDLAAIPSWSWASCAYPIEFNYWSEESAWAHSDDDRIEEDECRIVQYYYQDPEKGLRKLAIEQPPFSKLHKTKARDSSPERAIWHDCIHNPRRAASRSQLNPDIIALAAAEFPGSLVFNTTVASLRIGSDDENKSHGYDLALIYNAAGESVGYVGKTGLNWMRAHESSDGNKKILNFIVLSGIWSDVYFFGMGQSKASMLAARPGRKNADYHWDLTVMLVDRLPYKGFVARRVDIGTIPVCLWNECNPRWETVVLC
ncbi:hypothetical protein PGQ11_003226 [Apiospora arundinis]|uniref:Heterokaryon incompatibility domain-containing protein n=1 Tax=Apiospora arundinis TaxID=335852 RepID=A0ABR2J4K2_9PEZI